MPKCNNCKRLMKIEDFDTKENGQVKTWCRDCCDQARRVARRAAATKKATAGDNYKSRALILRQLGFASYQQYLQSDLWKAIRTKVFKYKGRSCYCCGQPATELHHLRYHRNDLLGHRTRFIKPVCHVCHQGFEFHGQVKTTLKQAKKAFDRKRKAYLQAQRCKQVLGASNR